MNEISAVIKRPQRAPSPYLSCEDTEDSQLRTRKWFIPGPPIYGCLDLGLPASKAVRNVFLLLRSHPPCDIFLEQSKKLRRWDTFFLSGLGSWSQEPLQVNTTQPEWTNNLTLPPTPLMKVLLHVGPRWSNCCRKGWVSLGLRVV